MSKRLQINVTFTEDEKELYEWVLRNAKMRKKKKSGISEFVKEILWAWYREEDVTAKILERLQKKSEERGGKDYQCRFCGSTMAKIAETQNYKTYYCERCGIQKRVWLGEAKNKKHETQIDFLE